MSVNPNDLDGILSGKPFDAMEAAKRIIQQYPIDPTIFISLATNKRMRLWTRTAAIWLLGFVDDQGVSLPELERIVEDSSEAEQIRDYAAEAIGHIKPFYG
jgi:hypothetical protein